MQPFSDLLGNQGGVTACSVIDGRADLDLVLYGFVYDFGRVFYHTLIQHDRDYFLEGECPLSQEQTCPLRPLM
jgi:hypothetical protein